MSRPVKIPVPKRKLIELPAPEEARKLATHLSRAFEAMLAMGIGDRDAYSEVQRLTLVANPAFLGFWSVWEPDALPGPDRQFRHAPAHDAAGRFVPYWNRGGDDLRLDLVTGYERPGGGDWYWVPKQSRQPCTAEPYLYPIRGVLRWIASELAPITARGLCLGVVGVDWTVDPQANGTRDSTASPVIRVVSDGQADKLATLTTREREVYFWLTQGKSNEEISIILGISAHTVKNHLDHIFQKLGVCNRLAAALAVQA